MGTFGYLTIKLFVHNRPMDRDGRLHGSWKTLFNRMMDREDVDGSIREFMGANRWINPSEANLEVCFTMKEHFYQ